MISAMDSSITLPRTSAFASTLTPTSRVASGMPRANSSYGREMLVVPLAVTATLPAVVHFMV
jgi:hypothetical protein